jgi:hypothetical protein
LPAIPADQTPISTSFILPGFSTGAEVGCIEGRFIGVEWRF